MRVEDIELSKIQISEANTRKDLDAGTEDASLDDLAENIRTRGLINPITVRFNEETNKYELIAGQRRYLAFEKLGRKTIPAIIREIGDDTDMTIISLVENVHRADMNPMDKARAFQKIYEKYHSYERVAKETGLSSTTVSRYMKLLELHPSIQERISTSEGVAGIKTLSKLATTFDKEDHELILEEIAGLKQNIQEEILKRSEGDVSKITELKEQAIEGAFNIITCRSIDDCNKIPSELIPIIKKTIQQYNMTEDLGNFKDTIRNLKHKL